MVSTNDSAHLLPTLKALKSVAGCVSSEINCYIRQHNAKLSLCQNAFIRSASMIELGMNFSGFSVVQVTELNLNCI